MVQLGVGGWGWGGEDGANRPGLKGVLSPVINLLDR